MASGVIGAALHLALEHVMAEKECDFGDVIIQDHQTMDCTAQAMICTKTHVEIILAQV